MKHVRLTALILILCLLMAGCGQGPASGTEPTETQTISTEATDPEDPQNSAGGMGLSESGVSADISDAIASGLTQTGELTFGIDVAKYQGTIDWSQVADAGIDFAMIRVGYRAQVSGEITADTNAKYNMQEAQKYGIKLGAYFFSTAVTEEEAIEEANWVADYIAQYPITYPVAYNCEGFNDPENRQYSLTKYQRTNIAMAFLAQIEARGYEAMFYASRNELQDDAQWVTSQIEPEYKIWVAQYPTQPYPATEKSTYTGVHHMWQYTTEGTVPGISQSVDLNVAYFGYEGTGEAKNSEAPDQVEADIEALMTFTPVNESVTAKQSTNLRSIPSQDTDSQVLYTLKNGKIATRIGISDSGWSKLTFNGSTYYAVSSYLTTDLSPAATDAPQTDDDGIETQFRAVQEQVTAKEVVNLRSIPSITDPEAQVIAQLKNGEVATRVGVSDNGWSKLSYNGQICYAVSSYLTTDLNGGGADTGSSGSEIQTQFKEVNEQVTAKEVVNLRSIPSTTDEASVVVAQLKNGEVITRTGINEDVGWSRVVYDGQVLYCISSYLTVVE